MIELTESQRDIINTASEYKELMESPGWKRILKLMSLHCDKALSSLKASASSDAVVNDRLSLIWREREKFFDLLNGEIEIALSSHAQVIEEVGLAMGATKQQIDELIDKESFYA